MNASLKQKETFHDSTNSWSMNSRMLFNLMKSRFVTKNGINQMANIIMNELTKSLVENIAKLTILNSRSFSMWNYTHIIHYTESHNEVHEKLCIQFVQRSITLLLYQSIC